MTGVDLSARGIVELARSLDDAATALVDPDTVHDAAAQDVLGAVDPPRLTGRLASTVRAERTPDGFQIVAGGPAAPYGPIVHARDPFLTRALNAREAAVVDLYDQHVDNVLTTIQGA